MADTRWYINEDGGVYEHDMFTQAKEFPNDFPVPFRSKEDAEQAAEDMVVTAEVDKGFPNLEEIVTALEEMFDLAGHSLDTLSREPARIAEADIENARVIIERIHKHSPKE